MVLLKFFGKGEVELFKFCIQTMSTIKSSSEKYRKGNKPANIKVQKLQVIHMLNATYRNDYDIRPT